MTTNPREFGQSVPQGGASDPNDPMQPCPRHPQRLTAVRCQRCDRPICPDCARNAAVGMQCVDCVLNATKNNPYARRNTLKNGGFRSNGADYGTGLGRKFEGMFGGILKGAPVTVVLVALCVIVYLFQLIFPRLWVSGGFHIIAAYSEPWRFLTAGFLHGSIMHLLMNMMMLVLVGAPVERALGTGRYISLYLLSEIGGSVGYVLWYLVDPSVANTISVGASGAGYGLFAAVYMLQRRVGADLKPITILLVANIVFSFVVPGIAWQAHFGGLIVGGLVTALFIAADKAVLKTRQKVFQLEGAKKAHRAAQIRTRSFTALITVGVLALLVLACLPSYGLMWPLDVIGLTA